MKTFRTVILIAGILVAGLALNSAFAQSTDASIRKERSYKQELKNKQKVHPKEKAKIRKDEMKDQREMRSVVKTQKVMARENRAFLKPTSAFVIRSGRPVLKPGP